MPRHKRNPFWTEERCAVLRVLWPSMEHTGETIGTILGCSRSAVIAKAHDLKLQSKQRGSIWTNERVERLKGLWGDTRLTGKEIGAQLGVSKTAAISKGISIGLPGRKKGPKSGITPWRPSPSAPPRPAPRVPVVTPQEVRSRGLSLEHLDLHTCRWPHGESHPYTFCGHHAEHPDPYCAFHMHRASKLSEGR
jgi:hypothetical protein